MMFRLLRSFLSLMLAALLLVQSSVPGLASETLPEESAPATSDPTVDTTPLETEPTVPATQETLPAETAAVPDEMPSADQAEPASPAGPGWYFGLLHAHSGTFGGPATPAEAFSLAAEMENMDFFAVTDHSHSFDHQEQGSIDSDAKVTSQAWAAGKAAAAEASTAQFVGLFGYEMSWPSRMRIGHIATFSTPGFQSWKQPEYQDYETALKRYYSDLARVPGSVSQFNHPGSQYGTFGDLAWQPEGDGAISLMEVTPGDHEAFLQYVRALDQGWHLAPTAGMGEHWDVNCPHRTAVYAQSLTEQGLYNALKEGRTYVTQSGLQIEYALEGHPMGARVEQHRLGETADFTLTLADPHGNGLGLAEIVTTSGKVAAWETLASSTASLTFSLPPREGFYFLKVTGPDGRESITAPIWIEGEPKINIDSLTCETEVPVRGEETALKLELSNGETADFLVTALEILANGQMLATAPLAQIPGDSVLKVPISLIYDGVGQTQITARLTGTLRGRTIVREAQLSLTFRQSWQVSTILVDGSHGNAGLKQLKELTKLAAEDTIELKILTSPPSEEELNEARFFIVPAPEKPFSDAFLESAASYARYGGSLVVCGQGDSLDGEIHSASELNRLLQSIGSTLRLRDDLVQDPRNNGGSPDLLYLEAIDKTQSWCSALSPAQTYRVKSGASVDPGDGHWLVKGFDTTITADGDGDGLGGGPSEIPVLLAWEPLSGGGNVIAAGSLFFADDSMKVPPGLWGLPHANRTIAQTLLGIGGEVLPLSTLQEALQAPEGTLLRIRGYVTAGTSNPHNAFANTLYLQDETAGIAVIPFEEPGIQQGSAMEITSTLEMHQGSRVLRFTDWKLLDVPRRQTKPITGSWPELLNPDRYGGALVQIEGICQEIYCWENDLLAGCLLGSKDGTLARIQVESHIGNGSDGENNLHKFVRKGRTIRATGLLHRDQYGELVIRVRNCEEVVFVPPRIYPGMNPPTGDAAFPGSLGWMAGAGFGLLVLRKKKVSGF